MPYTTKAGTFHKSGEVISVPTEEAAALIKSGLAIPFGQGIVPVKKEDLREDAMDHPEIDPEIERRG